MKGNRYFNTSGPNFPAEHYTLYREALLARGREYIDGSRYFTIWAPRQTGKSTYFRLLADRLLPAGYRVIQTNVENFQNTTGERFLNYLSNEAGRCINLSFTSRTFDAWHDEMKKLNEFKLVLIIDEIEGLHPQVFNQFLHTVRNLYHYRQQHCLKSVILAGVSNITGVIRDNASPFNIADNLDVPYFSRAETFQLLGMHETETGQLFDKVVKEKISYITGNQPGLVNGFARRLVEEYESEPVLTIEHYLKVENWYLTKAIDKNIDNIINKAACCKDFVQYLLFHDEAVEFRINDEKIKYLYTNGIIGYNEAGNIIFDVPLYKKALLDAFRPEWNGESDYFFRSTDISELFDVAGIIDFDKLIACFKEYIKLRSFRYFRRKKAGSREYENIKEAALVYTFDTYINYFLKRIGARTYLEPHAGLGQADLVVNYRGSEFVIEMKIYRDSFQYQQGMKQLAHYCRSLGSPQGIYLLFVSRGIKTVKAREGLTTLDGIKIRIFLVEFDEEKDF